MRIISNKALQDFSTIHPTSKQILQAWRKIIESRVFSNFAEIKSTFNAVDKMGLYFIFDVGGNKYRIICAIHFGTQKLFIRHVFTHKEYDKWVP